MLTRRKLLAGAASIAAYARIKDADAQGNLGATLLGGAGSFPVVLTPYAADVAAIPSLVGYWRQTDAVGSLTLKDFSTSNLPATIAGGLTLGSTSLLTNSTDTSGLYNGTSGTASLGTAGETFFHNWDRTQAFAREFIIRPNFTRTNGVAEGRSVWSKINPNSPFNGIAVDVNWDNEVTNKTVVVLALINNVSNNWIRVATTTDLVNGQNYHVFIDYDGSSAAAGVVIYVNGVRAAVTVLDNSLSATIINSVVPAIGSHNTSTFFKGNLEEVAIYNTNTPMGNQSGLGGNSSTPLDLAAFYHFNLQQNGQSPVANPPSVPNVFWDTDCDTDISAVTNLRTLIYLHKNGYINLIGYNVNSSDVYSASTARAILDYWGLTQDIIPVYAYQGSGGTNSPGAFCQSTATQFRSQDATNKGCTAASNVTAGTGYAVGDVLTASGGTVASKFAPTQITVLTVDGSGAILTFMITNAGSYSTVPSNHVSFTGGNGSGATFDLTTTANRGNYTDGQVGYRLALNAYSNLVICLGGFATTIMQFLGSSGIGGAGTVVAQRANQIVVNSGFFPGNLTFGQSPEFNLANDPVNWANFVTTWPSSVPIVMYGIENATPNGQGSGSNPGFVLGGPASLSNLTDPSVWAFNQAKIGGGVLNASNQRTDWTIGAQIYIAFGINKTGSAFQTAMYYGGNKGTMTINSAINTPTSGQPAGYNAWTLTPTGNWSGIRRRAGDSWFNSLLVTIFADVPGNYP